MPEQQFGRYRLVSLLGRGGMGEVWRAVDTDKDRQVALKVLGSWLGGDPDFAARFRRESALAARLNSPNIVPIHDYGEIDGRLYIDMPLIGDTDLATLLESGPLPPARAVRIVEQTARALEVAHRAGLVHRDVKPSNVLVSTDADDHAHLIDFGIAKSLDGTRLSVSGTVVGTPAYMAPECFRGAGDARSDVYSLGCVLYEALTGQPPYSAPHAFAYGHLHQHEPVPRPSAARPEVPAALDEVVARALAKSPDDRFATATEFATAARAALQPASPDLVPTVPVPSPPSGAAAAGSRRRGRPLLIGALAVVFMLVVVLAVVNLRPSGTPTPSVPTAAPGPPGLITTLTTPLGLRRVAVTELNGLPAVVVGRSDAVDVWDLRRHERIGESISADPGGVAAMTVTPLNGRTALVTSSSTWWDRDDNLSVWDLGTRERLAQTFADDVPGAGPATGAVALTQLDGGPVAVVSIGDDRLHVWDLAAGTLLGQPVGRRPGSVEAVALTWLDGRRVVLTNNLYDQTVRLWDLATGEPLDQPLAGHTDFLYAVATGVLDGRPIAVTASRDATVRIWDLATRRQLGRPIVYTGSRSLTNSVAVGELDARPVAVTANDDGVVQVWDLRTVAAA